MALERNAATSLDSPQLVGRNKNSTLRPISRRYALTLASLFASVVLLSGIDMLTTTIALNDGLREGNFALLAFARVFDLSFFQAIALSKVGFILGAGVLMMFGMKSNIQSTRNLVIKSMVAFAILLAFVSLNNVIMILQ